MNKGLEELKRLKWGLDITHEERINLCECIEKELKALEIIRNKKVDTSILFKGCSLPEYNEKYKSKKVRLLANEYNLLKEVLICESELLK